MSETFSLAQINKKSRSTQSLLNKCILDPFASVIVYLLANKTSITPIQVTMFSTALACISAFLFYYGYFLVAAMIFQLSVVLDACDGLLARTKNNGSHLGIWLDNYTDVIRLSMNGIALSLNSHISNSESYWLLIFLIINFSESFIDFSFSEIRSYFKLKEDISLNFFEKKLIYVKDVFEKFGLKLNLFYYHERIFFVLFIGPVTGHIFLYTILGIVLVVFSIHLKLFLDVAMIKDNIISGKSLYLRSTSPPLKESNGTSD